MAEEGAATMQPYAVVFYEKANGSVPVKEFLNFKRIECTMKTFDDYLAEELRDPEFKKEYDALELEFQLIRAFLDARNERGLTQKELSQITGITQADISKLENGNANPSIKTLERLAAGLGKRLKIELVPA